MQGTVPRRKMKKEGLGFIFSHLFHSVLPPGILNQHAYTSNLISSVNAWNHGEFDKITMAL